MGLLFWLKTKATSTPFGYEIVMYNYDISAVALPSERDALNLVIRSGNVYGILLPGGTKWAGRRLTGAGLL